MHTPMPRAPAFVGATFLFAIVLAAGWVEINLAFPELVPSGIANMIVRLAIRLMVLAAIIGGFLIVVFSWLAELLLPVFHRGKHAHPARAVHDSA